MDGVWQLNCYHESIIPSEQRALVPPIRSTNEMTLSSSLQPRTIYKVLQVIAVIGSR